MANECKKEVELGWGCTIIIQIGLSQHMAKLDLSLGAQMQVAILQWQPHCIDKSDVAEFDELPLRLECTVLGLMLIQPEMWNDKEISRSISLFFFHCSMLRQGNHENYLKGSLP